MTHKAFVTSDPHWGHEGTCTKFLRADGTPLRPFPNADAMNREMIQRWNAKVGPHDKVYTLGDVVISKKYLEIYRQLNGDNVLIKGNHDIFAIKDYLEHFRDVRAFHKYDNFALTHIPIHPASLGRWAEGNIHGHLHERRVMMKDPYSSREVIDTRYFCVSVEHTDYAPIEWGELKKRIADERRTNPRLEQS